MAKTTPEKLTPLLKSLAPVYLVCGDETLLVQEAADAIRTAARKQGFTERERYYSDAAGMQWQNILLSANSLGLFGDRKIIEIQLHKPKLVEAAVKVIIEYCERPPEGVLMLLIAPKIDGATQKSRWYKAVEKSGVVVTAWPVNAQQLPRWITQRLNSAGISASRPAVDILSAKVEGNLLAAVQEIEKLKLMSPDGKIDEDLMAAAVADSARYNVFTLVDKALFGDAQGAARCLSGLQAEGTEATIILWSLTREIRTLSQLKSALEKGMNLNSIARNHGVFDKRIPVVQQALRRLSPAALRLLLRECALADRSIKGQSSQNPWTVLLEITLGLAGHRILNTPAIKCALQN